MSKSKGIAVFLTAATMLVMAIPMSLAAKPNDVGFDEFGYNWRARNFVGTGESWAMGKLGMTHEQAEAYMTPYHHDKLVMKWNAEWDRGNAEGWSEPPYAAWCTNQWNGMAGGSGETWHYVIIWVGAAGSEYREQLWREGGYEIWGQFEVVLSHGTIDGEHIWDAHATPTGRIKP
ncbi:MAG: hypothetical protein ACETV0_01660 [Nitrososphaeria archaeon]